MSYICFQSASCGEPSSSRRTSATERKFAYRDQLGETGNTNIPPLADVPPAATVSVRSSVLPSLVKDLPCPLCTACSLTIRVANCNLGIVSMLETYCTTCEKVVNSTHSSDRVGASHSTKVPFTVTRSAVLATMDMGVGNAGLVKFCRCLDSPAMHHKTYTTHSKAITTASMEVVTDVLCESAQIVRKVYKDLDPSIDESGVIDLTVSFDGSWMTRGHKSLYGIGCVVEVVTGLVIDFAVLSLYCQSCSYPSMLHGGKNTAGFQQWHERHTDCNCNYHGSSGGMEVAAAEILWERSVESHRFRYTTMLSDGDSRTHKHLCDLCVYGSDVEIEKEECINHVAKRMGTALRKLASEGKKSGTTLGGRGYGKLKQTTIIKLTGYYGKAICSCPGDLDAMRNAVFATFFHSASTDEDPHHSRCPVGSNSWCFFQRALAAGEEPGSHRDKLGTPLTRDVSRHVEEVYVRLGHPDLLRRCLKGATQNANESLHSKVWAKCPKTGFVGFQRVVAATCAAIAEFNQGVESTVARTYDTMAMDSGINLRLSAAKADARRLQQSRRQVMDSTRAARLARVVARAHAQEADYAAGAF